MIDCPDYIFEAPVVLWAVVDAEVRHTGHTKHVVNGVTIGAARGIAICRATDCNGYFLFSCDSTWEYLADTWHESIDEARRQAEFEYEGLSWRSH